MARIFIVAKVSERGWEERVSIKRDLRVYNRKSEKTLNSDNSLHLYTFSTFEPKIQAP